MSFEFGSLLLGEGSTKEARRELLLLALAALFVTVNAIAAGLVSTDESVWEGLIPVIIWLAVFGAAHFVLRRYRPNRDPFFLPLVALLSGWGIVMLGRLAPSFVSRQALWLFLGGMALLLAALLPSRLWFLRRYRYTWLLFGLLLLAATLIFGVNPSGRGAELWLRLPIPGRVFFQPSELLKLLLIVFLAGYFDERKRLIEHGLTPDRLGSFRDLFPLVLMWGFSLVLLIWQRDLGAAALFFIVFLAMLYLATGNWRYIIGGLALLLLAGIVAYFLYNVVAVRVDSWWDPWSRARTDGFQIVQSLYAIASGNLIGQGIAQGYPTFVPVVHTDFTFAAIAEEWGLVGSLMAIISYALISYRGLRVAALSTSYFRMFMAAGLAVVLGVQALLILGGITRLIPLTGITLPFISYGGSSFLMSSIIVGLLLNLSSVQFGVEKGDLNVGPVKSTRNLPEKETRMRLRLLNYGVILSFAGISILVVYWIVLRGPNILSRDDNPRLIEQERRIERGRILDAGGEILAETFAAPGELPDRIYSPLAGPIVGYYSIEHGTSGIEDAFDAELRGATGDFWDGFWRSELLHEPPEGRDVRLTLDSDWQQLTTSLMDERQGAAVLLSLTDNAIRALVSYPTYDPNTLDEQFETLANEESAPLMNRVIQGQYQPGLAIQPFVLATFVDREVVSLDGIAAGSDSPVEVNGSVLRCAKEVENPLTWADILKQRCPGAMQQLAGLLGEHGLHQAFSSFGLTTPPNLPLSETSGDQNDIGDLELAVIGQDNLAVSPLQVALALATLANEGLYSQPKIVEAVQDEQNNWRPLVDSDNEVDVVSPEAAISILIAMTETDGIIEHAVIVLSGPAGETNAWYLGLAPAGAPRFAVVVVLESTDDLSSAADIGRSILRDAIAGKQ